MMTLLHRWLILGLLGLVILPCLLVADSKAETVAVSIRGDSVMIKMDLVLEENITALPLVNVQIGPSNSTLSQLIQHAIQKSVPGASLSSVEMSAQTSNSSGLWKLSERYTMIVSGASTNTGSRISIDLGFITMNVTSPIVVEGLQSIHKRDSPRCRLGNWECRLLRHPKLYRDSNADDNRRIAVHRGGHILGRQKTH